MLSSIVDKTNTIGILRSLGCGNASLIKCFIWEGLILGLATFAFTTIGHAALGGLLSSLFSEMHNSIYIAVFGVTPVSSAILFAAITLFTLIGCILPMVRLGKLKPMEYLNKSL